MATSDSDAAQRAVDEFFTLPVARVRPRVVAAVAEDGDSLASPLLYGTARGLARWRAAPADLSARHELAGPVTQVDSSKGSK